MAVVSVEWVPLAVVPFLAIGAAYVLYNAFFVSRKGNQQQDMDHTHNKAYQTWREWIRARGSIQPAFSSRTFDKGETCFAYEREVFSYEPLVPHGHVESDAPIFDTECGALVGEGWSILDCFEHVRFVCKGALFVTNKNLYLRETGGELKIPLSDVRMVATACSSFLIKAKSMERPLILTGVNGQVLRDIIYMLLGTA